MFCHTAKRQDPTQLPLLQTEYLFQTRRPKTKWIIGPSQQLHLNLNLSVEMSRVLQDDMPLIRRWWCALILDNFTLQMHHSTLQKAMSSGRFRQRDSEHAVMTTIYQLPHEIIATGDSAYLTLSLVCRWFRDVVTNEIFQKAAHFAWLDCVVNWKKNSPDYCEFRRIYSFRECLELFLSPIHQGTGEEEDEGNCWAFTPKIFVQDFARRTVFLLQEMNFCKTQNL
ncbi:uncharacterized protein LOC120462140 [Pimephales promelas]|uniref:uncharacterized protein LOC120462140 n=1 Tax=Pimephales promelas TaxID=90988 RepID=UPI001955F1A3|nr:uncharacterized protein LOC120462140 [Pimephales promelas]